MTSKTGRQKIAATSLVCVLGIVLSSPINAAENNQQINCDSGWRSITKNVMSGEGQASISAQCRSHEKPCPPRHELVRRAKLVANAYALANIQSKVRSEVSHEVVVENGVGTDRLAVPDIIDAACAFPTASHDDTNAKTIAHVTDVFIWLRKGMAWTNL
jgi:hypothetical protein